MSGEDVVAVANDSQVETPSTTPSPAAAPERSRGMRIFIGVISSLSFWMVVGMGVGILLGTYAPDFSVKAKPTANLFLRPIQFVVFPLVFSSLVAAIAGHGDFKALGRLGLKSFIYFEVVTTLALIIGLVMVNLVRPGDGVVSKSSKQTDASTFTYDNWITHLAPKTWGEMMSGELLQTLVASIIFGCATAMTPPKTKKIIVDLANAVMKVMFEFVNIVIWTAPIGVAFSIAYSIGNASNGLAVLSSLGKLVACLYGSLIIFVVVVLGSVFLIARINPFEFFYAIREPLLIAFTTATSEAALPRAIETIEEYGVTPRVAAFVLPFGYSFNLDGSTLYLSLASVFCAQATGVEKSIGEQIVMVLLLMVTSKGVAGVRQASLIVLASSLTSFNIPADPIAVILGVDWFMDMGRTFVNVLGNCLATVYMAKLEKEFRVGANKPLVGGEEGSVDESVETFVEGKENKQA
ncbi:hypothetical protein HDU97_006507 [Phlyctochytrium planicorne]|nr:hypothetical protein HDU97_006507 [Phlyctochytrium planicorne]